MKQLVQTMYVGQSRKVSSRSLTFVLADIQGLQKQEMKAKAEL